MSVELAIGRLLAVSVHPVLAWRRMRPSARIVLVGGYFGVSYVAALLALLTLR